MANKKNKNVEPQTQAEKEVTAEAKRQKRTKIFLISFAVLALVGILTSVFFALNAKFDFFNKSKNKSIDFMKDDLSKYVYVSPDIYSSYDVTIDVPKPTDLDFNIAVIKALCKNKITPDTAPTFKKNVTISAGDVVGIYYRGYTLNGEEKVYFDGGCNFTTGIYDLEIGSGSFVAGFEYNLIGKNQQDYATLEKLDKITAEANIYAITYNYTTNDGKTVKDQSAVIDLNDPELDTKWGEGFRAFITNPKVLLGSAITEKFTPTSGNIASYENVKVTHAFKIDNSVKPILEVEAYFPHDYQEESLRGKTAHFEVYINLTKDYDVPELNDAFVTDTLKLKAEDLAQYDGATLLDKYYASVRAELNKEYEDSVNTIIDERFWRYVVDNSEFKEIPESEIENYCATVINTMENMYYNGGYSQYYQTFDAFATAYMSVSSGENWRDVLDADAEESVKQKLAFYYVVRECEYIPSDEEYEVLYEKMYNEVLQSYLDYYGIDSSSEDYETKKAAAIESINAEYDEDYWRETIQYEYGMEKIRTHAKITYK